MKVGLDHYTIAHRGLNPATALEFVSSLGLDGVQFLDPRSISPDLDPKTLDALRDRASELGMYLEIGISSPNPMRASLAAGRTVDASEFLQELTRQLEAAARLGVRHVRAYIGDRHDRFRSGLPWLLHLDASLDVMKRLAPALRSLKLRIAIETHADLTVVELLRLLESLGPDLAGVTLDTGNLLMRLEDPLHAVEQLAPWVLATHVKDAVLARTARGVCWQARPIGAGLVPIREMIDLLFQYRPDLNLSIELHPRTYDLPIHDPAWLAFFPELPPTAIAFIEDFADRCERLYENPDGKHPRPEVVEAIPWAERDIAWIAESTRNLREIVARVTRND